MQDSGLHVRTGGKGKPVGCWVLRFLIHRTGESEDLGAKGFRHWRAYRRLFLTYAAAGRTMEGRDNLELQLTDHIAFESRPDE
jgi:hypothetical protein